MEVGRIYDLDQDWWEIQRLWSQVTVFDEVDTTLGRTTSLKRLRSFRDKVEAVISELENEQETESWLE